MPTDDSTAPPAADRLTDRVEAREYDAARSALEALADRDANDRKTTLRELRSFAADRPAAVRPLCPALASFLADDERAVRLTTAKLFVAVAEADPDAVVAVVDALGDRLADGDEFYYVRARCAEALGAVALEHPTEVASPEFVADLRIGLEFDDPEVRTQLAKALERVARGDPTRLSHRVSSLAEHLADDEDLVRYHLTTALVAIGCERPDALAAGTDALVSRVADVGESDYVRARAAEALGALARAASTPADATGDAAADSSRVASALADLEAAAEPFVAERARYALAGFEGTETRTKPKTAADGSIEGEEIATLESVAETTATAADAVASSDGPECPHCGCPLPAGESPMCPQCGAPW